MNEEISRIDINNVNYKLKDEDTRALGEMGKQALINVGYYVCSTQGSTAAKTISAADYTLSTGGCIKVKMDNKNTANNATLNINSQGAKALYYQGERASATNSWDAEEVVEIYYDGTNYYANNVKGGSGSGVYDVSKEHPASGPNGDGKFTLEYILNSSNVNELIPVNKRHPGMSIQFVSTYDNKYVQYRLAASTWSTDIHDWTSENPYFIDMVMREVNEAIDENTPIEITGDVTNAPDEEDLTSVNIGGTDVLKFKDKAYTPLTYSGLGRKYLRKNMVNGVNTLTQSMINEDNTVYVIQYDFSLGTVEQKSLAFTSNNISSVKTSEKINLDAATEAYEQNPTAANLERKNAAQAAYEAIGSQDYYFWVSVQMQAHHALHLKGRAFRLNNSKDGTVATDGGVIYTEQNTEIYVGCLAGSYSYRYDNYVAIPENSALEFDGGSLSNGTIVLQNTVISGSASCIRPSLVVKGNYVGFIKMSWLGVIDDNPSNSSIIKRLDEILVDCRNIKLDSNVLFDEGEIIFPSYTYVNGNGYTLSSQGDGDYLFALSKDVSLNEVNLRSANISFTGIILLWSTAVYKGESPVQCTLSNVNIFGCWNEQHTYLATGLKMLATADGEDKNYISDNKIHNLSIKFVKDGLIIHNDNTNGTTLHFAWSNLIRFDTLFISSKRRAISILGNNPNGVGEAISPYQIDNLWAQAGEVNGLVYYMECDIALTLRVINEAIHDYSWDTVGILRKGHLYITNVLVYRYSYDIGLTDEELGETYNRIYKIRVYSGSLLSIPDVKTTFGFMKSNYDPSAGRHQISLITTETGFKITPDASWDNKGSFEYYAGTKNSILQKRKCDVDGINNTKITTNTGFHFLKYDGNTGGHLPMLNALPDKEFASNNHKCVYQQLTPNRVKYICYLKKLTAGKYYYVHFKIKNTDFAALNKNFLGVTADEGCELINSGLSVNTKTIGSYSEFYAYIVANKSDVTLGFNLKYGQVFYGGFSAMDNYAIGYFTSDIVITTTEKTKADIQSYAGEWLNIIDDGVPQWRTEKKWIAADGALASAERRGTTRPVGSKIYVGFMFFDTSLTQPRPIFASEISGDTVTWVDATGTSV